MYKNSEPKKTINQQHILNSSFEKLLENRYARDYIIENKIIKVKILSLQKDYIVVDTKFKCEGLISIREFQNKKDIKIGDIIEAFVEERENPSGWMILSKEKADKIKIWNNIEIISSKNKIVEGKIVSKVKGGLQVEIGVKAFLPGSQIDLKPIKSIDTLIGKIHKFHVIKINKKRGNIVLSRRLVLEQERSVKRKLILNQLKEGIIIDGIVKNLTDYGAFIDLGGVDGLLHVTDMSWGRIQKPSDILQCGDSIKVKVLKYDANSERVSLGVKQIQDDPWDRLSSIMIIGTKVKGKIVSLTDYGVFVELQPGVEGLIHISEMSWNKRVKHPSKIVDVGDEVDTVILDIDTITKRISLGMKQVQENPWTYFLKKYPVGAILDSRVQNITDFGIFVHIENGIDGLVHISDISWGNRIKHPSETYKRGDQLRCVILSIDIDNRKLSLGIKQLYKDPWDQVVSKFPIGSNIKATVKKITDFGAFLEIVPGIDGLLHVSEFSNKRVEDPKKVLYIGDQINVMILDVDTGARRIGLSIKALENNK